VSETRAPVDVLLLWHHHQPDYRSPREGRSLLPWVRLHATKDYLDMALHLERHPGVRATFNFVPSLLDQLDGAAAGAPEALFALIARPPESLTAEERAEIIARCGVAPRHAFERWPRYAALCQRLAGPRAGTPGAADLLALEVWFLLAWLDPLFHGEPEAQRAIAAAGAPTARHRDDLLALGARLTGAVIPAYRALAERGQIELSASPYFHPILPLLADLRVARRARPDLLLPSEPFAAPADAERQIASALERHASVFGAKPRGMWPPEGGVSPEAVALVAGAKLGWLASDEGVLWRSLPPESRPRDAAYRPWRFSTAAGDVTLFFRDRELSDRIGFVYQNWEAAEAAADMLARLRRIGADHAGGDGARPPLVTIVLDGENCWEHYAGDGGPFLEALYGALEQAPDIRTRTPSEILAAGPPTGTLTELHSGSWIDADFHIWIGHPEKNRAWDLIARARRALAGARPDPGEAREAWAALDAACGSDWMWWFGDDHFTPDKPIFDRLFREHLQAVYEQAGLKAPTSLAAPITRAARRADASTAPLGFVRPTLDGRPTQFYEWYAAGRFRLAAGGAAMHRSGGLARDLYFGFDATHFYLRLDFTADRLPGEGTDLTLEFLAPRLLEVRVHGLARGERMVSAGPGGVVGERAGTATPLAGSACHIGSVLELALPFEGVNLRPGESVDLVVHLGAPGEPGEALPPDDLVRFTVPGIGYEEAMWSV
jgi:alpha-amylase/alpha-mannosidase (GH57 family)